MNKKEVVEILQAVKPALANKEVVEQTTSFIFANKRVFTFNDEVMISHPIALKIKGAVPAKEMFGLLSQVKTEEVSIKQTENEVSIEGGTFKAGIALTEKITLPIKDIKISDGWKKLSKKFCEAVEFCLFSASTDYSKVALTHIHVSKEGFVESADNFRVTRYTDKSIKASMLIPVTAAKELVKYEPTHYQRDKGWIHCKNKDDVVFSFRTHISKYPDTSKVLKMKGEVIKFPPVLADSLSNAETLSKEEINGDRFVTVSLKGKKMSVKSEGDVGWYKDTFNLRKAYGKDEMSFEINSKSFREILTHLKKGTVTQNKLKFEGDNFVHVVILKGV